MKVSPQTRDLLLSLSKEKKVFLEGNLLKVIKADSKDTEFAEYLKACKNRDNTARKKRLEVTKQVQSQNKELANAAAAKEGLMQELQVALGDAEKLRDEAVEDLDLLQKRTQFELIGLIVKVALVIIVGVGVLTTLMYIIALLAGANTTLLGNAWSNMFGILLTNSFSIIGTIMGVKYATEKNE
jgi:hypothetical protein